MLGYINDTQHHVFAVICF